MILRRDPFNTILLATAALSVVASVAVCAMGAALWKYDKAGPWAWLSILFAGGSMVLTWLIIKLESIPDAEIYRAPQTVEPTAPRKLPLLPPDGYQALSPVAPIQWPNVERGKLHRALQVTIREGVASVRKLREARLTEDETAAFRAWIFRNGWGTSERGAARLNQEGREQLAALLPHAREYRQ